MINVNELPDGKLQIEWDENDPLESIFNDWTEKDFQDFFAYCASKDSGESGEEYQESYFDSQSEGKDFTIEEDDITEEKT